MATVVARRVERRGRGAVVLRGPCEADVPAWIEYERALFESNPHQVRELSEFDPEPEAHWERLKLLVEDSANLAIVACPAEEPGRIIGDLSFRGGRMAKMAHHGHFGIAVAAAERGTGLGGAMIRAMLDWAAGHERIEKVALGVFAANSGAIRLYERCGFREEGRRLRYFRLGPGRYVDDVQMAIWVKPGLAPEGFGTHRVTA